MKKIVLVIFCVFIILILIFVILKFFNKKQNTIEVFGNVEIRQVDLSFQVSGRINNVYFQEGDYVKQGQLLATLNDKDYRANYKKALALEMSSKAQAKEDLSKYNRNKGLCFDDTISKQECETLLNKKDISKGKYEENSALREFHKNQLDYTKLYAPSDGIITTRAQEKGSYVSNNQIVYVMSLTKPIWIRTYIKETDLGNIKYGQKAYVYTDSVNPVTNKKKIYNGYVGYISPVAEFTPKTVQTQDLRVDLVYRIRVYIDEPDEYLRQGMPTTVHIKYDEAK